MGRRRPQYKPQTDKEKGIEVEGKVLENLPNARFRVELDEGVGEILDSHPREEVGHEPGEGRLDGHRPGLEEIALGEPPA